MSSDFQLYGIANSLSVCNCNLLYTRNSAIHKGKGLCSVLNVHDALLGSTSINERISGRSGDYTVKDG